MINVFRSKSDIFNDFERAGEFVKIDFIVIKARNYCFIMTNNVLIFSKDNL